MAHREKTNPQVSSDAELVEAVKSGSVEAWHEFIDRHSRVLFTFIRRQLFFEDEEAVRNIYVDILKELYDGGLDRYDGRSSLVTWLVIYARGRTLDHVRRTKGRSYFPPAFDELTAFDQKVCRYHFIEGMTVSMIVEIFGLLGDKIGVEEVAEAIHRVEVAVGARVLKRLQSDLHARRLGAQSGRELEYIAYVEQITQRRQENQRPDSRIEELEKQKEAKRAWSLTRRLSREEREVIEMKFKQNRTAAQIAEQLEIKDRRRVYTVVETALRKLRGMMKVKEEQSQQASGD